MQKIYLLSIFLFSNVIFSADSQPQPSKISQAQKKFVQKVSGLGEPEEIREFIGGLNCPSLNFSHRTPKTTIDENHPAFFRPDDVISEEKYSALIRDITQLARKSISGILRMGLRKLVTGHFKPQRQDRSKGIVLIHGTGVSSIQWGLVEEFLYDHSKQHNWIFGKIHCVDYDHSQEVSQSLSDVLDQIDANFDEGAEIFLVGHSQGGLIAHALANGYGKKPINKRFRILGYASLCGVLRGAPLLDYLKSKSATQKHTTKSHADMACDSTFIAKLRKFVAQNQERNDRMRCIQIGYGDDLMVPYQLAWTDDGDVKDKILVPVGSHFTPAHDKQLWTGTLIPILQETFSKIKAGGFLFN